MNCAVEGCDLGSYAKGYCNLHYWRVRRKGEPGQAASLRRPVRTYKHGNPRPAKDRTLWYKFRLTLEDYDALLIAQGGGCANPGCFVTTAGGRGQWHVDHDRSCCAGAISCGECVRGLLCNSCNAGLGLFHDDIPRLEGAIAYLQSHKGTKCA